MDFSMKKFISQLCSLTSLALIYWRLFNLDDPSPEEIEKFEESPI